MVLGIPRWQEKAKTSHALALFSHSLVTSKTLEPSEGRDGMRGACPGDGLHYLPQV